MYVIVIVFEFLARELYVFALFQYGTLKKATGSSDTHGDTPGYIYEELISITFSDTVMATQLAIYLTGTQLLIHFLGCIQEFILF